MEKSNIKTYMSIQVEKDPLHKRGVGSEEYILVCLQSNCNLYKTYDLNLISNNIGRIYSAQKISKIIEDINYINKKGGK